MNLYEIDETILSTCIDTDTGEIIDEATLTALAIERDRKITNIALWIKNLDAEAEALKNEKMKLAARQKVAENKAEQLRKYLGSYLNGTHWDGDPEHRAKISFRYSSAVEVTNKAAIPASFLVYKEPDVDKTAIKKAILDGREIPGAELVGRNNIQIK